MKRVLLCVLIAAQAARVYAQQPAPDAADAEKALRTRAEQFYQLQVEKKYRQSDAFVAEDTKDFYFASNKGNLLGFSIGKIELSDNNTRAKLTVKSKTTMLIPGAGQMPFEIPSITTWKIENGQWMWYVDLNAPRETPFGEMKPTGSVTSAAPPPDLSSLAKISSMEAFQHQVVIDKTSVELTDAQPSAQVTITNNMPGFVDVSMEKKTYTGFDVKIDQTHVPSQGKAVVTITKEDAGKPTGTVHLSVAPLNVPFDVQVRGN